MTTTTSPIDTGGGAATLGDLDNRAGVFIGRDLHLNVELRFTAGEMQGLLDQLLNLLRLPGVRIQNGAVNAQEQTLPVGPAQFEALGKYLAATPAASAAEREARYLARLCVHPDFQQWQTRYVTLSGGTRDAPELTPRYSQIQIWGDGPQRERKRVPLPDIREAVQRYPAFLLLGLPGGGKTTVLQRLALDQALARLHDPDAGWLPLWTRLASQKPNETPHEFLARMWRLENPGGGDAEAELLHALHGGRLCILCDALNEASRERIEERTAEWGEFARTLPAGNRLVFSCRSQDYLGKLAVQQVEIDPLTDEQIADFSQRYLGNAQGAAFWDELRGQHSTLLELARTPFYLKMMVEEHAAGGSLPPVRARLFASFTEKLFGRELLRNHPDWIEPAAQHRALSQLAFAMQEVGEGTDIERAWALNALPEQVTMPNGEAVATPPAVVLRLAHAATLLAETSEEKASVLRFRHHLLQEYFAAGELLWRLRQGEELARLWRVPSRAREMPEAERGQWEPLPGPPPKGWEQTTILAAGLSSALIAAVQPVNPTLAARCALESGLDWQNGEVDAAQVASCRQALLARLGDVGIHLRSRIEAGLLLGQLKDPRFPVETVGGVRVILPPLIEIAAAQAKIGSSLLDWGQAFADEFNRHQVSLAAYAIGRYPVTNAEYACFMAAGGYEEEGWWTAGGRYWLRGEPVPGEEDPVDYWMDTWRRRKENPAEIDQREKSGAMTARDAHVWRARLQWTEETAQQVFQSWYPQKKHSQPELWDDDDFNNLSQPVVGVCWYEATAYARWLAATTKLPFRLPLEPEWEWAARRGGRAFPWGRGWQADRLNSLEGRVMRTTPVGAYPHGVTPDGINDLAGNVWEWTATRYADYPYRPEADLEDPNATGRRVVRGGGWAAHRRMVRCSYRDWGNPWHRNDFLGYRLARSLE
jgi:formylglycine-generating enzyme required for sulfatase activity